MYTEAAGAQQPGFRRSPVVNEKWTIDTMLDSKTLGQLVKSYATYVDESAYHALFARLRKEAPLAWAEPEGCRPFWVVTKHADIRDVELQAAQFVNATRTFLLTVDEELQLALAQQAGTTSMGRSVVQLDGDEHRKLRHITQHWFNPANIRKLESDIRLIAREAVDEMMARGGACDFVRDVALWYPLRVILSILGLPRADEAVLIKMTQGMFSPDDPDTDSRGGVSSMIDASQAIRDYFQAVTLDRRKAPRDDVATVIANAVIDGNRISDLDAAGYYVTLITAGHDTTSSTTAGALLALLQHPQELAKLRSGAVPVETAVNEFLRWTTPIKHFFRTATADCVLRDTPIAAGDSLMMCYPSANRDEDVFPAAASFRVDRGSNRHLAFGYGPHVCLGQHLAKLEIRIFYEELLARLDHIALAGTAALTEANFVQGLKRLPIAYSLRPAVS